MQRCLKSMVTSTNTLLHRWRKMYVNSTTMHVCIPVYIASCWLESVLTLDNLSGCEKGWLVSDSVMVLVIEVNWNRTKSGYILLQDFKAIGIKKRGFRLRLEKAAKKLPSLPIETDVPVRVFYVQHLPSFSHTSGTRDEQVKNERKKSVLSLSLLPTCSCGVCVGEIAWEWGFNYNTTTTQSIPSTTVSSL